MIYVSTGLNKKNFTSKTINIFLKNNITNIELSSGFYEKNINKKITVKEKKINYLIHNYFPVPKNGFVFNLSSNDKSIRNKSINLAIKAIQLSKKINADYYSFHGGFLIDPDINTLGEALETKILISKKDGVKNFINSVQILSAEAKKQGLFLLIENNVLTMEMRSGNTLNPEVKGLKELVAKLKPEQKIVLDLVYFRGFTHAEVSEELEIPLGTVKTRLRNAIISLRKVFN